MSGPALRRPNQTYKTSSTPKPKPNTTPQTTTTSSNDASNDASSDPYPNYLYPRDQRFLAVFILVMEVLAVGLLGGVCFAAPNLMSGGSSVLRDSQGGEYVGVLSE